MMKILLLFIVSFSLSFPAFSVGYIIREAKIGKIKVSIFEERYRIELYLKLERNGQFISFMIRNHINEHYPAAFINYSKDGRSLCCENSETDEIKGCYTYDVKELIEFSTGTRISSHLKSNLFSLIKNIDPNDVECIKISENNRTEFFKEYRKILGMAIEP